MAIETEGFCRDEIYTLFVTTRIVNFLKGLPLQTSMDFETLMKQRSFTPRIEIGFELLREFAESGRMYFWTKHGLIENKRFRTELFRRVLSQAQIITCQNGRSIGLNFVDSFFEGYLSKFEETARTPNRSITNQQFFDSSFI